MWVQDLKEQISKDQTNTHAIEELEHVPPPIVTHVEVDIIADEFDDVAIIELKTQDVILDMLNEMKNWFLIDGGCIEMQSTLLWNMKGIRSSSPHW